ncbi:MAG: hypothetical protein MI674_05930 [Cytophagales bacterium]|nr:hypothetical protein [Cytophagales bacterium]
MVNNALPLQDEFYKGYLGILAKHAFLASAIHQFITATWSTMPFAVAQIQDVGLIFLAAIASSIADKGIKEEKDPQSILSTTLLTLALSTLVVGILVMCTGGNVCLHLNVSAFLYP